MNPWPKIIKDVLISLSGFNWHHKVYRWSVILLHHFSWDDELAEVAQIWADQCANVVYFHNSDIYPRIFHERGFERTTSRFNSAPGVGQNVAWALTKHVNFTRIIDDLWYRDINKLQPGRIDDFQVRKSWPNFWPRKKYWGPSVHMAKMGGGGGDTFVKQLENTQDFLLMMLRATGRRGLMLCSNKS